MVTSFQFLVLSVLLFLNVASHAKYFNYCSPALCSEPPRYGIPERCSCRPDCYLYNECCSDIINNTTSDHRQTYPSIYYSCRNINGSYYYQFDRCPPNHDVTKYVSNCENPDSDDQLQYIPAFGKTSKRLYRNLYCALCHGEEFILWNILYKSNLSPKVSLENVLNYVNNSCRRIVKIPTKEFEQYLYSCVPYISSCPRDHNDTEQRMACQSEPMALIYLDKKYISHNKKYVYNKFYKSKHCATCNGISKFQCRVFYKRMAKTPKSCSLTILFNYHTNVLEIDRLTETKHVVLRLPSCPKYAVYDMNTKKCRQFIYHPPLNCITTTLNKYEYHITSDGLLYLNTSQRLLNQSEFMQDAQGIISICVKNDTNEISTYSVAEKYITFVGLGVSIPALAITIIVYLCIPDLRTLPGKLLISLFSALLVAEFLFLISSQVTTSTVLCTYLAIVIHYSFLATFFWMNVVSFDAWCTFSGLTQLRSSGKGTKRLALYSLYAWICPLVIVTVSLIFEYTSGNHGHSPEYGNGICWITNKKSLLWFFAIPVMIILCLNIIAFILIVRGLYMESKRSSKYLSEYNKKEFFICIKLLFIMGLTWIFAFLYTFTRIEEFSLLFCILNSFVGLFICLSFLSTKIVRRSLLQNLHKIKKLPSKECSDVTSPHNTISMAISAERSVYKHRCSLK